MPKSSQKTCPSLYALIEHGEPKSTHAFLRQDEFRHLKWLAKYRGESPLAPAQIEELLHEPKSRLEALDREAARVLLVREPRGQFALSGLVQTKLKPTAQDEFKKQKDELARSLWAYLTYRFIFEGVESAIHLRLYRHFGKHYQSFQADNLAAGPGPNSEGALDRMLKEIESRLDMGSGCKMQHFDLPGDATHPATQMYIIYHPNPLTSAREISEDGERRTFYFRPPGEATVVYTPSTGAVEVRADTKIIRRAVAECFAKEVLGQQLSSKPLGFREYDLSRFFGTLKLDCPDVDGFHIATAGVIKAEVSVGNLGNRLAPTTTIHQDIDSLIDRQPGLRKIFQNATAIRFIEIAVQYTCSGETEERTLDFTISDQNSCSLLSLPEERERVLGHRLLRHWGILHELRPADADEKPHIMPVLLELWNSGMDHVVGSWLEQRNVDASKLTETGFLEPAGWEGGDLVNDDEVGTVDARVIVDGSHARHEPASGQDVAAGNASRFRKFRVDHKWLVEYVRNSLSEVLETRLVEELSPNLVALGSLDIDGSSVAIHLARRLDDPKVLADSDHTLRGGGNQGIGLVLSSVREPFRCLGANVVCALPDCMADANTGFVISLELLRAAFRTKRHLARGGQAVEFLWDEGEAGELFVPGVGSIQISGHNRLVVIDRLVKAYRNGPRAVKTSELTKDFDDQSLPNIFGKDWDRLNGRFIRSPKHGFWEIASG